MSRAISATTEIARPLKKILCPTDFSSQSYEALAKAVELALESGAELHLFHVVSGAKHLEEYPDSICSIVEHMDARRVLDGYIRLKEIIDEVVPDSVRYRLSIRQGDPAAEILRRAKEESADMIILGSHARRRLSRFISSSVADRVIRQATCPVITIQPAHQ